MYHRVTRRRVELSYATFDSDSCHFLFSADVHHVKFMDIYALWMIQTIYGAKGISSVHRGTLSSCSSHFASYTGPLFIAMGGVYAQINIPHQTTDRPLHYKDGRPTGCRKNVDYHHGCTEVLISCVVNDVERMSKPDHTSFVFQTCGSHRQ